jgi:hypothetical protein
MGIDIYAEWADQTEAEEAAQITGFSIEHGCVGYLREAYHGAPYVTKYLVAEAFDSATGEAEIPASVLRERLPAAVLMSMYREHKVYGEGDPEALKIDADSDASALLKCIVGIFENEVPDMSHLAFVEGLTDESLETASITILMQLRAGRVQSRHDRRRIFIRHTPPGSCRYQRDIARSRRANRAAAGAQRVGRHAAARRPAKRFVRKRNGQSQRDGH